MRYWVSIELLLDNGEVDVNKGTNDGWTALMSAAENGHHDIVELLLNNGEVDANKGTKNELS